MRQIEGYQVNEANKKLECFATDEPAASGAHNRYAIKGFNLNSNPSASELDKTMERLVLLFQNGPINEVGCNGVTHEALLAVLADRLRCFQAGPFANKFNARALEHIEAAQAALLERTQERINRGVEGTHAL